MKKFFVVALIAVALALASVATACKDDDDDGGDDTPISKTYPITFKDGALKFTVEYIALPNVEPAYLAYIKERLEAFVASTTGVNVTAVNTLLTKGNSFKITIEYAEPTYTGMEWDITLQSFKIHNDWIFTASGVTDLTLGIMRNAFNSVVIDLAEPGNAE